MIKHWERFQTSLAQRVARPDAPRSAGNAVKDAAKPWLAGLIDSFEAVSAARFRGEMVPAELHGRCAAFLAANAREASSRQGSSVRH